MPTYVVTTSAGRLSQQQKCDLAASITRIHCTVTGAPAYFAQVLFNDVQEGNYFVAGKPLVGDIVFVHGEIRAGRDLDTKQRIILEILEDTARIARMDKSNIQIYIADLPAKQIAEWGKILPDPDEEAEWFASIPDTIKQRMRDLLN
jgi:phenylpyruvate tautomerase PptA (4-oxalocrotonate tautomerase family)